MSALVGCLWLGVGPLMAVAVADISACNSPTAPANRSYSLKLWRIFGRHDAHLMGNCGSFPVRPQPNPNLIKSLVRPPVWHES